MDDQIIQQGFNIIDPLYGTIPLGEREQTLISTPEFQRLKRLKQLGFLYLVKDGAVHTRFEHSLGVYILAQRVLAQLLRNGSEGTDAVRGPRDCDTLLAASLLHDIGHYPFPQALERLSPLIPRHEILSQRIICGERIAHILRNKWHVEPERVMHLVLQPADQLRGVDLLLARILSSEIDVDKLDYLNRDSHCCGLQSIGHFVDSTLNSFTILRVNSHWEIGISANGMPWKNKLLEIRQELTRDVYGHNLNRSATVMLSRAVQDALLAGAVTAEDLARSDDESVFHLLKARCEPQVHVRIVSDHSLHKRIV